MSRENLAKWILEKLLGSFIVSVIIIWGPLIGLNFSSFQGVYTMVVTGTSLASLLAYILVPRREKNNKIIEIK